MTLRNSSTVYTEAAELIRRLDRDERAARVGMADRALELLTELRHAAIAEARADERRSIRATLEADAPAIAAFGVTSEAAVRAAAFLAGLARATE